MSGIPTELHVYPGAYHGFHFTRTARVTKAAEREASMPSPARWRQECQRREDDRQVRGR